METFYALEPLWISAVLLLAFAWAHMEIQIEGPHGWAKNLPTWRMEKGRLNDIIFGGAEITGYHFWAFTSTFLFFHLPFAAGRPWTFLGEARAVGAYVLFWIIEDFLWFVLNPAFGWRAFRADRVPWHRHWFLGLPANYWIQGSLGALLYLLPAVI